MLLTLCRAPSGFPHQQGAWIVVLQQFQHDGGCACTQEIYYGTKTKHFRAIHKASGIPYREMLFFDNERGNCRDVAALGVTCVYTPEGASSL